MTVPIGFDELRRRLESRVPVAHTAGQRASVAIILGQVADALQVLFIRRAEHPEDPWSGHMALPGGRRESTDVDDLATAIRETREETGVDLRQASLLGRLDDVRATARGRPVDMTIACFVFSVETLTPIVPTAEATASFWTPILPLLSGQARTQYEVDLPEGRAIHPAWDVEGNVVWGLTYRMMSNLLSLMKA